MMQDAEVDETGNIIDCVSGLTFFLYKRFSEWIMVQGAVDSHIVWV